MRDDTMSHDLLSTFCASRDLFLSMRWFCSSIYSQLCFSVSQAILNGSLAWLVVSLHIDAVSPLLDHTAL